MNKFYPAIFHEAEEGGFWVEFPDLDGCFTQGKNFEEAFSMAKEALSLYLDELQESPVASKLEDIQPEDGAKVVLVKAERVEII